MVRKAITSKNAISVGPYSHGIDSDGLIFLSGQTPINPVTGKLTEGDIKVQTQQGFQNLFNVLKEAGLEPDDVQKVNVYLTDMNDFTAMNKIYETQFSEPYPARTTIGVASLPLGAKIEIEMIARKKIA
ncbi:MAG: Rid family detoxifying hydrolase [Planctomycetaceae bacterium]|jgi:2-iminobutanoate/2-iminopropanoate deaminase|nr:Rid family detoxifying hydrolase [Planctomycetaceae bacterium]